MSVPDAVRALRSPTMIRSRAEAVLAAGLRGDLTHFRIDLSRLDDAARRTADVTRARYPSLHVPPHSRFAHFAAGGVPRLAALERQIADRPAQERARALTDVVVTSVLLDAGSGAGWQYHEPSTGLAIGRSEGLAVASLAWVAAGGLSSRGRAYEVDAAGLAAIDESDLARAFQVSADNPLVGVEGRVHLLRALGATLSARTDVFGAHPRIGGLIDFFTAAAPDGALSAEVLLGTLLDALSAIWPGRLTLAGCPLGDVWKHPAAGGDGPTAGLVPFHKLSQWLSYSLLLPLEVCGISVPDLDALTGLAEYRNGGLFIDTGVLVPNDPKAFARSYTVDDELVVEWRALTIALLDRVAPSVCRLLGTALPLASVLEGGTWAAGRAIARELRDDGGPPFAIISDGTVF